MWLGKGTFHLQLESIIKPRSKLKAGTWSQTLQQRLWRITVPHGLLSLPSYIIDLPTVYTDEGNFSIEVPSSKVTLAVEVD